VVTAGALSAAMEDDVAVVSVMHANNEIGTIQPIEELAKIAHAHGALFHTDAVQSAGKIPVNVRALGVDLLSLSGHKFYGPKGAGALWIRRGVRLAPILTGGRHERNRRAGTENVPGLIGLGVAAALAKASLAHERVRLSAMRDRLERLVLERVPRTSVNGAEALRVPNTSNISFDGVEAESLLIALDLEGIAVSTGSACSSGTLEPSHVLKAMNLPAGRSQNAIRFSLGSGTTDEEIDRLVDVLPPIVEKLRSLARMPKAAAVAAPR
jgi:cysteine desulfurase